jgi:hypothetical protein
MGMTVPEVSPNRVIASAIVLFVAYWIAAIFVPAMVLRDVSNSLTFGLQTLVVITWWSAARRAIRNSANDGAWVLVLAVWFISFVALLQRIYAITFNWMGQPEAWQQSAIAGFWPYSFGVAAALFLVSPAIKSDGVKPTAWWTLLAGGIVGGFVSGVVLTLSVHTF